jgi:hypothetical protein
MKDHSVEGFIGGVLITLVIILPWASFEGVNDVSTAITDNGCSSHQELKPTKTRIENYNLTNL